MINYTPVALYHLAKLLYPKGFRGDNFLPIEVEGQMLELRFSTDRGHGDDVEFLLFIPKTRYCRRCLLVWEDGRVTEDTDGSIPDFDRLPGEVAINANPEHLLPIVFSTLWAQLEQAST